MTNEIKNISQNKERALEQVMIEGDLTPLSAEQRVIYYNKVCESLGLNPLTKPFSYIKLNGKLTLYALKDCTEQLRKNNQVSLQIVSRELQGDVFVVTARATSGNRMDESIGAVTVKGLGGDALANAYMKAETKAKRRVTLSLCGLGMLDDSEVDSIPGAHRDASVNIESPLLTVNTKSSDDIKSVLDNKSTPSKAAIHGPTEAQIKRLFAIAHEHKWSNGELKDFIGEMYGIDSTKVLSKKQYDELCEIISCNDFSSAVKRMYSVPSSSGTVVQNP